MEEEQKSNIYFVKRPYFREALMLLSFRKNIDWLEDGMSLMSWEYKKVASVDEIDHDKIYDKFKKWDGNKRARIAGHRTIAIGDIVEIGANIRVVTGSGWLKIPEVVWNKIKKD